MPTPKPPAEGPDLREEALATPRWLTWLALGALTAATTALLLRACSA